MLIAVIEASAEVSLPSAASSLPSAAVMEFLLVVMSASAVSSLVPRPNVFCAIALVFKVTLASRLSTVDWSAFVAATY